MPEREEGGPEGDDDEDDDEDEGGFGEQMGLPEVKIYHTQCCKSLLSISLCNMRYSFPVEPAFWHTVYCIQYTMLCIRLTDIGRWQKAGHLTHKSSLGDVGCPT